MLGLGAPPLERLQDGQRRDALRQAHGKLANHGAAGRGLVITGALVVSAHASPYANHHHDEKGPSTTTRQEAKYRYSAAPRATSHPAMCACMLWPFSCTSLPKTWWYSGIAHSQPCPALPGSVPTPSTPNPSHLPLRTQAPRHPHGCTRRCTAPGCGGGSPVRTTAAWRLPYCFRRRCLAAIAPVAKRLVAGRKPHPQAGWAGRGLPPPQGTGRRA